MNQDQVGKGHGEKYDSQVELKKLASFIFVFIIASHKLLLKIVNIHTRSDDKDFTILIAVNNNIEQQR